MIFNGRWVPAEVMNTIFLLWLIAVVLIGCVLLWLRLAGRKSQARRNDKSGTPRDKRRRRRR